MRHPWLGSEPKWPWSAVWRNAVVKVLLLKQNTWKYWLKLLILISAYIYILGRKKVEQMSFSCICLANKYGIKARGYFCLFAFFLPAFGVLYFFPHWLPWVSWFASAIFWCFSGSLKMLQSLSFWHWESWVAQ